MAITLSFDIFLWPMLTKFIRGLQYLDKAYKKLYGDIFHK